MFSGWISTGLIPQIMCINLCSSWVFRKIVIKCISGVEGLMLSVPGSLKFYEMEKHSK